MVLKSNSWLYWDNLTVVLYSVFVWLLLLELSHFHRSPGEARDGSVESHPSCRILVGDASIGSFLDFLGRPPIFCLAHFCRLGMALSVDSS